MIFNFTNILLLFGMLQCALMILLIFFNRNWRKIENRILLALLFTLLASLIPPFFGNSRLVLQYDFLRFLPLYLSLFIFPLLYLYVKALFSESLPIKQIVVHLFIPFLFWSYFSFVWVGTLSKAPVSKGIWARGFGYFTIQTAHDILLISFTIGYVLACFKLIGQGQPNRRYKEQLRFITWIKTLTVLLAVGVLLETTATLLGKFYGYWRSNPIDEWLGFSFSFMAKMYSAIVLYGISLVAYVSYSSFKRRSMLIGENEAKLLDLINEKMQIDKLHLDTELTLGKFSSSLGIPPARLSALLNNRFGTTFNDFVNRHRVQEVIQMVTVGDSQHLTLEAISENAGFKSKTTFYRAFKKYTSKTPKAYFNAWMQKK